MFDIILDYLAIGILQFYQHSLHTKTGGYQSSGAYSSKGIQDALVIKQPKLLEVVQDTVAQEIGHLGRVYSRLLTPQAVVLLIASIPFQGTITNCYSSPSFLLHQGSSALT